MLNMQTRDCEWYANDFVRQLHLDPHVDQKCERTCLLWSKDHWANEAKKTQVTLQQLKEKATGSGDTTSTIFQNAQFLNTIAQVYGKLFGHVDEFCNMKQFDECPYSASRQDLLKKGSLASVFVTILHKAATYAMLDQHPLDNGLIDDKYNDVYGVDLTYIRDIEASLSDGRFEVLYEAVLKRAKQVAGIGGYPSYW